MKRKRAGKGQKKDQRPGEEPFRLVFKCCIMSKTLSPNSGKVKCYMYSMYEIR